MFLKDEESKVAKRCDPVRAARRRITSGSNRLRAAGMGFAANLCGPLVGRSPCRCPPRLLLRRRRSGRPRGSSARYTDGVWAAYSPSAHSLPGLGDTKRFAYESVYFPTKMKSVDVVFFGKKEKESAVNYKCLCNINGYFKRPYFLQKSGICRIGSEFRSFHRVDAVPRLSIPG